MQRIVNFYQLVEKRCRDAFGRAVSWVDSNISCKSIPSLFLRIVKKNLVISAQLFISRERGDKKLISLNEVKNILENTNQRNQTYYQQIAKPFPLLPLKSLLERIWGEDYYLCAKIWGQP